MNNGHSENSGKRERGVILVMGLVLLLILTMLGFSSMRVSSTQQRTGINHDNKHISRAAAEAGASVVVKSYTDSGGCSAANSWCSLPMSPTQQAVDGGPGYWMVAPGTTFQADSAGDITVEVIGLAKNSAGTELARSVLRVTFSTVAQQAGIWVGADLKIHDTNNVTLIGNIEAADDIDIDSSSGEDSGKKGKGSSGTANLSQANLKAGDDCSGCTGAASVEENASDVEGPPSAATVIAGMDLTGAVTSCSSSMTIASNTKYRCNSNLSLTNAVNASNVVLVVTGDLTFKSTVSLTGANSIVATKNVKFETKSALKFSAAVVSGESISAMDTSSFDVIGSLWATSDVHVHSNVFRFESAAGFTAAGSGSSSSGSGVKIKAWNMTQ